MAQTPLRWSQAAEQWLLEFNDALVCDVLVVGTGYGGSFAAQVLAGPDTCVWVLERGREYLPGDFPSDIGTLPGHVRVQTGIDSKGAGKRDGVLDFRRHDSVAVLVANGLGGGSLINAGVALKPDDTLCQDPRWPSHYRHSPDQRRVLWQAMDEVQTQLQATPFLGATELKKYQALAHLGQSMGEDVKRVPLTIASQDQTSTAGIEQAACTRCGNCFTGCNVGAKNTMLSHVLPQAVRKGARLVTGATVLSVRPLAEGTGHSPQGRPLRWEVEVVLTSTMGSQTSRQTEWVRTHTVVLAAGALGSTEILLRSKEVACSPQLGQRFSTNGDVMALGWGMATRVNGMAAQGEANFAPTDRVGPTITGALSPVLDVAGQKQRVLIQDGAVPSALTQAVLALGATLSVPHRYTRDNPLGYFAQRPQLDPLGTPPELARHALLLLGMGPDNADGALTLVNKNGSTGLDIRWAEPDRTGRHGPAAPYYKAVHRWLDSAEKAGGFSGGDALPNPLWKPLPADFGEVAQGLDNPRGITVHPLGGCAMADGPDSGVVDWRGAVFKPADGGQVQLHEGLHVLDGATLPSAVGVNPFVTIAALSLVAARDIQKHMAPAQPAVAALRTLGSTIENWPKQGQLETSQPVPDALSPAATPGIPEPVVLRFSEHLQGHWQGPAPQWLPAGTLPLSSDERLREWVVAVDVQLDVAAWLADPGMRLEGAYIKVYRNTHPHELSIRPETTSVQPVLEGKGWVRLLASDPPASARAKWVRMGLAALAFVNRRSLTEALKLILPNSPAKPTTEPPKTPWERVQGFVRAARNHAQWRSLDYAFDLLTTGHQPLAVRATGSKKLAYTSDSKTLWDALVQLDLQLTPNGHTPSVMSLEVDLVDMVRQRRLQVARAAHTPDAIIGLAGFSALWLRTIFQTHFWSLRGLDYHQLAPPGPAEHGPLHPLGTDQPICRPFEKVFTVPRRLSPNAGDGIHHLDLTLTRYDPPLPAGECRHLLMVHGLAHGGTVFTTQTTGGKNMAAAFLANGYTVWVLDHRLSNRLWCDDDGTRRRVATLDHSMDDVACIDIPAAVAEVFSVAGAPIDVFAHCVGAGAFAMATLKGLLNRDGHSMIRAASLHAVHPWVVPSTSNQLSGELAAFYRDFLPANMAIDPVPPSHDPGAMDQVLDRLAASLPWPAQELAHHNAHQSDAAGGTATCNRMTLFYGREWVHANLADATHRELASLVGPASVEVFRQLYFVINRQRLTDRHGAGVYMSAEQFGKYWTFPTLFCHGTENRVFDPRSAVRSWHRLRLQHELHPQANQPKRTVRLFLASGYGHMDFLFGKNAHSDVYPALVAFMRNPQSFESVGAPDSGTAISANASVALPHLRDHAATPQQAPLTGPMLQVSGGYGAQRTLVVWAELANQPLLGDAAWVARDANDPNLPPLPGWQAHKLAEVHPAGTGRPTEVTLLNGPGSYWVGRLSEPADGAWAHLKHVRLDLTLPTHGHTDRPAADQQPHVLDLVSLPWWQRWTGGGTQTTTSWLATSCRWPGTPFEREAVDHLAFHMLAQVYNPEHPAEALVLLGDQIYADATANLFDLQEDDERLAQFYREAWGSPHARRLLASVPTYMVIDDHELVDNWNGIEGPNEDPQLMNGFEASMAYQWRWTNPAVHAPCIKNKTVRGFWREFTLGGVPAIAMDTRTERERRTLTNAHTAELVSDKQFQAVQAWLLAHRNRPKVLCSGSVLGWAEHSLLQAPARCAHADGWVGYPATWKRLVRFMVQHQIKHTIFLSGDYHFSGVAELSLSADGPQPAVAAVSVVCSGWNASLPFANAGASDFALDIPTPLPFSDGQGHVLTTACFMGSQARQFSKLTLTDLAGTGYSLQVQLLGESGNLVAEKTLAV